MINIKFTVLIISFTTCTLLSFSQVKLPENYNKTITLFNKFENKLDQTKKAEIKEGKFFSPIDSAIVFLEVLKKETPDLYNHTDYYAKSLFTILKRKEFSKNQELSLNIIRVLYHLKIDNYIELLNNIYCSYKQNKMDIRILLAALFTSESYYSNLVVLNYKNPRLQLFLNKISNDSETVSNAMKVYPNFLESINDIKNGALFNEFQTTQKGWFFVYEIPEADLH